MEIIYNWNVKTKSNTTKATICELENKLPNPNDNFTTPQRQPN